MKSGKRESGKAETINIELAIAELVRIVPDLALEIPENRELKVRSVLGQVRSSEFGVRNGIGPWALMDKTAEIVNTASTLDKLVESLAVYPDGPLNVPQALEEIKRWGWSIALLGPNYQLEVELKPAKAGGRPPN